MGISGRDPAEIYKSITLHKIRGAEGLSFFEERKGDICDRSRSDRTGSLFLVFVM
jgi:hypothetical protein